MSRFIVLFSVVLFAAGCDRQSTPKQDVSVATTPAVFNVASLPTVAFNAPDMMCPDGCGVKVKEILSEQPGVKEVIVDFDGKTATVAIGGDSKFDADAAVAALVDHGFKNSSVKSDGEVAPATEKVSAPANDTPAVKPKDGATG
jgi:copper chaperone CopZ